MNPAPVRTPLAAAHVFVPLLCEVLSLLIQLEPAREDARDTLRDSRTITATSGNSAG